MPSITAYPSVVTNYSTGETWGTSGLEAQDDAGATVNLDGGQNSKWLAASGFNFASIPALANITNIQVEYRRTQQAGLGIVFESAFWVCEDVTDNGATATDVTDNSQYPFNPTWDTRSADGSGNFSHLFDVAIVQDANFGVIIAAENLSADPFEDADIEIDFIRITVTYDGVAPDLEPEVEDTILFTDRVNITYERELEHTITFGDQVNSTYFLELEDTLTITDLLPTDLTQDASNTLNFTHVIRASPLVGRLTDTVTFSATVKSSLEHGIAADVITFSDSVFRFNINRESPQNNIFFSQGLRANIKPELIVQTLTLSDTVTANVPFRRSLSDTVTFSQSTIEGKPYYRTLTDTLSLSNVATSNVKIATADNSLLFTDSHTVRNTFRQSVSNTVTFSGRVGEINILKVFDVLTLSDTARSNFQIGEAEDEIEFWDEHEVRGTIKESLEDDLEFEQVLEHNKILNLSIVDCLCFSDLGQSVEYASLEDTITFTDDSESSLWLELRDTLTFDHEVSVEGVNFLAYPCVSENLENPDADEEDNTLLGEDPFEDFELEYAFDIGIEPDTSRQCGDGIFLNWPNVEQDLVFSDSVSPFGDRGNTLEDELGWTDYAVGFRLVTRR